MSHDPPGARGPGRPPASPDTGPRRPESPFSQLASGGPRSALAGGRDPRPARRVPAPQRHVILPSV
jgi:hypothetical protein